MSKRKKNGGGAFGNRSTRLKPRMNTGRKADWAEVPEGPILTSLRGAQKEYPEGFLVYMNDEYGWAFEDNGAMCFVTSNAAGELLPHVLAPGQRLPFQS